MLGTTEEAFGSQNVAAKLIDVIINQVMKAVQTRTIDPGFEILKLKPRTNKECMGCTILKGNSMEVLDILETQDSLNVNNGLPTNICYSSLANLSEMCMHSSTLSASSQQGEGDQSPSILETTAFYRLGLEPENDDRASPVDYLDYTDTTETTAEPAISTAVSNNEVLQQLHDNLYNMSFDDIELDHQPIVKAEPISSHLCEDSPPLVQSEVCDDMYSGDTTVTRSNASDSRVEGLQHSQKFCHYDDSHCFSFDSIFPGNRNILAVDHNYNNCSMVLKDNSEEIVEDRLSESSQELASVEGESGITVFDKTNPFRNPFLNCSPKQSVLQLSCYPSMTCITTNPVKNNNSIEVVAEVEPIQEGRINWEEALEVQVNVTDPVGILDPRVEEEDEETDNIIQTRQFWSSVGLMTERKIDPKYLGPSDSEVGLESIKGLTLVQEKHLSPKQETVVWITGPQDLEETESINLNSDSISVDRKVNYLNISGKTKKEKKKRTFITRLSNAVSGIFRTKKK